MTCPICGGDPCGNPNLCAQCRKADERTETKSQLELTQILDGVHAFLGRFVIYPSKEAHDAHVLWVAHTHCMDAWESTPRIAFLSPEPASGKTRALEVSELLVPNAVEAVNVTPAYLFRKVGDDNAKATVLYDEIDTIFGPKAKENEEIRGLLNAGHRRGAVAGRCVVRGNVVGTEEISAYCAVALAGLGWLPDTILSRSIIIRMRRRAPHEKVAPFRRRDGAAEGHKLRDRLAAWGASAIKEMTEARPEMPVGVEDRDADVWEPLLAIADSAGEDWPDRARRAAVALVAAAAEREPSLGIRLLTDLREIFGQIEQMMATRLRQYGVRSKNLSIGGEYGPRPKGYTRCDLYDAWERYLPPIPDRSATAATGATNAENPDFQGSAVAAVADDGSAVADGKGAENADETGTVAAVAAVADVAGNGGGPVVCAQYNADAEVSARVWIRPIQPPAISAGPDDDIFDIDPQPRPRWLQ
jgi:hypothetical protein